MEIDFVEVLNLGNDGALMPLLSLLSNDISLSYLLQFLALLLYDMTRRRWASPLQS